MHLQQTVCKVICRKVDTCKTHACWDGCYCTFVHDILSNLIHHRRWSPQVLRDPALKQQYDQQLAHTQLQQEVFISQTIPVAEMQLFPSDLGTGQSSYLAYPCRCGGWFQAECEILDGSESVIVQCDTCSLHVQVLQA